MTEAVYESCPVAEESWEFMKRKREENDEVADEEENEEVADEEENDEVADEEENEEVADEEENDEVADEDDEESDVESCKFSEYGDIQELPDDSFPEDVSIEYREYCKQEHLSEGFNVPSPPPKGAIGCICEIYEGEVWWPYAEEGAEIAVAHYNDNRAPPDRKLRFVRLETVNRASVAGSLFFITFEAENVTSKEKQMYQSKLYRRIDAYWQVILFRKKKLPV